MLAAGIVRELSRLLIDKGANLDIQNEVSYYINILLSFIYSFIFKLIIIIIVLCEQEGSTALILAASFDFEITRLLIGRGANLDIQHHVS